MKQMEIPVDRLSQCPLFFGVPSKEIFALLKELQGRAVTVLAGTELFREGDLAETMGLVLSGTVQITRHDYKGNRSLIGQVGAFQMFAEVFACAGVPLPVTVTAATDSEVLLIPRQVMVSGPTAGRYSTQFYGNLLQLVARRSLALHQKVQVLSCRTTREKLLTYLTEQAKIQKSNSFVIPFDRQELADYLEVERSAMSAELSKLRKEGVLETKRSWFRLY